MKLKESLDLVSAILLKAKDKSDLSDLLEDILTPSEIVEIGDRITVIRMLKEGIPQREIAQKLGISITTVSRGSRLLNFERRTIQNYV